MARRTLREFRTVLLALGAGTVLATPLAGQLPSASSAALGFADNYTAAARGYNAIAWNPANLALTGNPQASLAIFPVRAVTGLGPVTLGDLKRWGGKIVPEDVRTGWLDRIRSDGKEAGGAGADLTFVAVQVRRVGFQLSTTLRTAADLNTDAARLILFGNAPNGQPLAFKLGDSQANGAWTSTAALSYAQPFPVGTTGARLSVGGALKYTMGHAVAWGHDEGSTISASPVALNVSFPLITTDTASFFNNGSGIGLDLGGAYQAGNLTVSAALQNVFNSFRWSESELRYRAATAYFTGDSSSAGSFDERPVPATATALVQRVMDERYKPVVLAGAAYRLSPRLLVDGDFHARAGDGGLQFDPRWQLGAGAEYRLRPFLPLRAGAALITGGEQLAAGIGFELGAFSLNASIAHRADATGGSTISMITLISSFPRLSY